jgi:glycine cleavage system H protein
MDMAVIEKFLGRRVEIPEDRRYAVKEGLWGKIKDQAIEFGLSQPALVLLGGVKDMDWLVKDGEKVEAKEAVIFVITGKILYIDSPVAGRVQFHSELREDPKCIMGDSYGAGWLFRVQPAGGVTTAYLQLASAKAYLESLKSSEGFRNPEGLKGGVSGICKAVYTGIGDQKM